jgi:hypothetical protein
VTGTYGVVSGRMVALLDREGDGAETAVGSISFSCQGGTGGVLVRKEPAGFPKVRLSPLLWLGDLAGIW